MPDDPHPFLGPARSPEWAKLARLAGVSMSSGPGQSLSLLQSHSCESDGRV